MHTLLTKGLKAGQYAEMLFLQTGERAMKFCKKGIFLIPFEFVKSLFKFLNRHRLIKIEALCKEAVVFL